MRSDADNRTKPSVGGRCGRVTVIAPGEGVQPARSLNQTYPPPTLEVVQLSKRFGGVQALDNVNFTARAGEVVALVGDNGAGKSTLIKAISGIHTPDSGRIRLGGANVSLRHPSEAVRLGIATVYQDLALCDNLDVVANLYLGREAMMRHRGLDEVAMEARARSVLAELSVRIPNLRVPVGMLSGGQRQAIAVTRSVMWDAKVMLLDEPTAALGVEQTQQVLDLVRTLKERNLAVVIISHSLADVFAVADRISVLRLGRRVADVAANEVSREDVVALITGAAGPSPTAEPTSLN